MSSHAASTSTPGSAGSWLYLLPVYIKGTGHYKHTTISRDFFRNFAKGGQNRHLHIYGALRKFLHIDVPRLHLVHSKQNTGILVSLDSILAYRGA